jgi:predicted DsbA family dithiol-disulfide isomerase
MSAPITIDIVSDVVCPWCFIGKRHLDAALAQFGQPVTLRWLPFFLNPDTPPEGEPYRPFLEKKFGGPEALAGIWGRVREAGHKTGIAFEFEKIILRANTLAAHRLNTAWSGTTRCGGEWRSTSSSFSACLIICGRRASSLTSSQMRLCRPSPTGRQRMPSTL